MIVIFKHLRFIFPVVTCILILSKFYYQLVHKRIPLKEVLKFTLTFWHPSFTFKF